MKSILAIARDSIQNNKLTRDIIWSMGSFFILAISGIVINMTIAGLRDAASLGIFNLAYAVYIVASQLAVWGIHYSVLRYAAYYRDDPKSRGAMFYTALTIGLSLGFLSSIILFIMAPWLGTLFQSNSTGSAIRFAAIGLLLFPLNKILLAYLNGLREIKAFSVLQAIRYLAVMLGVSIIVASSLTIEHATLAFLFAEVITTSGSLIVLWRKKLAGVPSVTLEWVKQHFKFGTKGLAGGMFAEFNSRIDVLLIGFFLTDYATGIYSFAAMLVDGLYHIIAMVRLNFNPILVTAVKDGQWANAQGLMRQTRRLLVPLVGGLALCIVFTYYILAAWVLPGKGLMEGMPSLIILLTGVVVASSFIPFDNLMVVSGHPGYQALQQIGAVTANTCFAILFLPLIGVEGAATGTALSYVTNVLLLYIFTRRILGWNLISNSFRPILKR